LNYCRWRILPKIPADHPINSDPHTLLIKQVLFNRGLSEAGAIALFFNADSRLSFDPLLLPDIDKATQRINQGLLRGERIAVYGDFDVDGICATALLVKGLKNLGGDVHPYIPHRLQEGHGLNSYALAELREHGTTLVITADCGITGTAHMRGAFTAHPPDLDLVITDHHLPLEELPPAVAIVDPKRKDSLYPFAELAGVGVAYKVLQALYRGLGRENEAHQFLDLVALGTVADLMPLLGENRYMVKAGLELLKNAPRPGIRELAAFASIKLEKIDAQDISFGLAPRLNAAGRLEHAISAYDLLVSESADEANKLAAQLAEQNTQRQRLTSEAVTEARAQVQSRGLTPIIIVNHPDFAGGILGLVAGRLCDEFYHPAIAISGGEDLRGSCRSIPEFNITEALASCSDLLTRFGGHAQAAGFSLSASDLPEFVRRLNEIAEQKLATLDLRPQIDIDSEIRFGDMGGGTYADIQALAPFGAGNAAPVFLSRSTRIADCRTMGAGANHLRFKLKQGTSLWDAVAFGMGDRAVDMQLPLDIVYNLEKDDWNGESRLRLNILDFAPAGANI
jgi:single-stranded-DNA-specific exonuclease